MKMVRKMAFINWKFDKNFTDKELKKKVNDECMRISSERGPGIGILEEDVEEIMKKFGIAAEFIPKDGREIYVDSFNFFTY